MEQRERYLQILQRQKQLKKDLPFLVHDDANACNAHELFTWQKLFFLFVGRLAFITAANQVGKSSISIIKILNLATRKELWPKYFKNATPSLFVYFYPDQRTGRVEFEEKWVKYYLPRGLMKDSEEFGWYVTKDKDKNIDTIVFNSGVTIHWRYYSQQTKTMQAISADYVALDEECPEEHWDELMVRTSQRAGLGSGLVSSVFTATLGQEYLYRTMEMQGTEHEKFPNAFKQQISLFDCLSYANGAPSKIFTRERIQNDIIPMYSSDREIQRRVYGRFVKDSGLLYQEFDSKKHSEEYNKDFIEGWSHWCGIDFGAGGPTAHPSTICFVVVDQDFIKARVVYQWKSMKDKRVTQGDVLKAYSNLKKSLGLEPQTYYDGSATDLGELALREGIPMMPAQKSHEIGVGLLNSMFGTNQLKLFTGPGTGQIGELTRELGSILTETKKGNRKDDCADSLRYALSSCPIRITKLHYSKKRTVKTEKCERMRFYKGLDEDPNMKDWGDDINQSLAEAQEMFQE